MNVVLYTKDFEPITVIDLELDLLDQMETKGGCRLVIPLKDQRTNQPFSFCTVVCKKLSWSDGSVKPIFIALEEDVALALKPSWLSGQRSTINLYETYISKLSNKVKELLGGNNAV